MKTFTDVTQRSLHTLFDLIYFICWGIKLNKNLHFITTPVCEGHDRLSLSFVFACGSAPTVPESKPVCHVSKVCNVYFNVFDTLRDAVPHAVPHVVSFFFYFFVLFSQIQQRLLFSFCVVVLVKGKGWNSTR